MKLKMLLTLVLLFPCFINAEGPIDENNPVLYNQGLSSDSTLKTLVVNGKEIKLKDFVYDYKVISKKDGFTVEAHTNDSKSYIEVSGKRYGSNMLEATIDKNFELMVFAEDGTVTTYNIVFEKPNYTLIAIIGGTLILFGIGTLAGMKMNKKEKAKEVPIVIPDDESTL